MTKEQKILLLFVLIIAGAGATYYVVQKPVSNEVVVVPVTKEVKVTPSSPVVEVPPTSTTSVVKKPEATSKTFKETTNYQVPENHSETIIVTTSIDAQGNITDITFAYNTPTNKESRQYLGKFDSAFNKSMVVGKNINSVNLARVGGASLTTGAFNKSLQSIKTQFNG